MGKDLIDGQELNVEKTTRKTCYSYEGQIKTEKGNRKQVGLLYHMVKVLFPVLCECHSKFKKLRRLENLTICMAWGLNLCRGWNQIFKQELNV